MQHERLRDLKNFKKQAKRAKNEDQLGYIREMIGEEKQIKSLQKKHIESKGILDTIKQENKDRVSKGLAPVFKKKREFKEVKY